MGYGESNYDVSDDVMWPWQIEVPTCDPICLVSIISKLEVCRYRYQESVVWLPGISRRGAKLSHLPIPAFLPFAYPIYLYPSPPYYPFPNPSRFLPLKSSYGIWSVVSSPGCSGVERRRQKQLRHICSYSNVIWCQGFRLFLSFNMFQYLPLSAIYIQYDTMRYDRRDLWRQTKRN